MLQPLDDKCINIHIHIGLKEQTWEKLKFLLERSIAGDLQLSALALEHPSQGISALALEHTRPTIERTYA